MLTLTSLLRPIFMKRIKESGNFEKYEDEIQFAQLKKLLKSAAETEYGKRYGFKQICSYNDYHSQVPLVRYEDIRDYVMRMLKGEKDILWHGVVKNYAQSSGTSDGKSKYIPITQEGFRHCHYQGTFDTVAHYLKLNPGSRVFDGKAFILGGSFANEIHPGNNVKVGDLSANLIDRMNPLANLVRIPSKQIALLEDWSVKLPALVEASLNQNVTNISGVPSWFLSVIKEVLKRKGVDNIHDVWPNLEVFFHGGISFRPYREQYNAITDCSKMHYLETYNASEGFFAVQTSWDSPGMMLIPDSGIFYEFIPLSETDKEYPETVAIDGVEKGKTYELVISSSNGLWRYRLGDTVRIEQTNPVKITIAGRTKHFINAFGEELMVYNADEALERTLKECGGAIANYTVAPVFATRTSKGRHEWLIEFEQMPDNMEQFAETLDRHLKEANSDYEAKRFQNLFIDRLTIVTARHGIFDEWLKNRGGKLGGQRKIPRLSNDRTIMEELLKLNNKQ